MRISRRSPLTSLLLPAVLLILSSCSSTITATLVEPTFVNMQRQRDVELVCEGTPSYLLMIDSLIAGNSSSRMLSLGIKAYGGYLSAMAECDSDPLRMSAMADKARAYSMRLMAEKLSLDPAASLDAFRADLDECSHHDAEPLFWAAFGWVSWVKQQQGAPAAMADLSKIESLLKRIIELNEKVESGAAHLLLGAYYSARPAMLGGNPQQGRYHFERALLLSERKLLAVHVLYAETYCRVTMDNELHDMLLNEVALFPLDREPDNTLANQIAKRQAARLLQDGFFD